MVLVFYFNQSFSLNTLNFSIKIKRRRESLNLEVTAREGCCFKADYIWKHLQPLDANISMKNLLFLTSFPSLSPELGHYSIFLPLFAPIFPEKCLDFLPSMYLYQKMIRLFKFSNFKHFSLKSLLLACQYKTFFDNYKSRSHPCNWRSG